MATEAKDRLTLTIAETAKLLGISTNSCYLAARRKELPVIKIGARLLVSKTGLDKMLTSAEATNNQRGNDG